MPTTEISAVLAEVRPRSRTLRTKRDVTLPELAATTGTSRSTLARPESGQREPSLELLLPIAEAFGVTLDELVGVPAVGDPRIRLRPHERGGRVVVPLTQEPRGTHASKVVIPPERKEPDLRTHDGDEWLSVRSGALRLILARHDVTMEAGELTALDTAVPHWFAAAGDRPVGILSTSSGEGERVHVRAAPKREVTT